MVAEGYKQTEVGVIPEDWGVQSLGEIAQISAGGTPSRSQQDYWSGSIPWITTTEISGSNITKATQYITKKGLDNSAAKYLPIGTLLLALYGQGQTRGRVGMLCLDATTNQACAAIQVDKKCSKKFIFHYLSYQYLAIREMSNSGSQDNLNSSIVRSIKIPLPPSLAEQEAIAGALSDADGLIESLEQLIEKKRQIKQGAMQELLSPWEPESQSPETNPAPTSTTPNPPSKKLKQGWIEKTLSEIAQVSTGSTPSTVDASYYNGDYLFVSPSDMGNTKWIVETDKTLTKKGFAVSRKFRKGSTLFVCIGSTIGKCAIAGVDLTSNQQINAVMPILEVSDEYVYYALCMESKKIKEQAGEQAVPMVNKSQFADSIIYLPILEEQIYIASILSNMDTEIATLEAKLSKAKQIKQGMMQELLTGKTRLI